MYKIVVFAPKSDVDRLIQAMGDAGAGKIGNYSCCAFVTSGTGYWKPLPGSKPTEGKIGEVSKEEQYKIEMICSVDCLQEVVLTIRRTHSYETPEINVIKLVE